MQVTINGKAMAVPNGCTIATLLMQLQITGNLAVELNGEIVPRSEYATHTLQDRDCLEVVHAIGGG
jgi:sulfur carrier protein